MGNTQVYCSSCYYMCYGSVFKDLSRKIMSLLSSVFVIDFFIPYQTVFRVHLIYLPKDKALFIKFLRLRLLQVYLADIKLLRVFLARQIRQKKGKSFKFRNTSHLEESMTFYGLCSHNYFYFSIFIFKLVCLK